MRLKMKKRLIFMGILVTALAISAWGYKNPAAVYCTELGYDYTTKQTAQGDMGACRFSDGTDCEAWDFLQGACGMQHSYCSQKGYQQRTGTGTDCGSSDPTAACLLCIMQNGSAVEVGNAMDLYSKLNDIPPMSVPPTASTVTPETTQTTEPTPTTQAPVTTYPLPETTTTTTPETTQTTEPIPTTQEIIVTTYPEPPTTIETPTTNPEPETTPPETTQTTINAGTTTTIIPATTSPAKPFDILSYLPYALILIVLAIAAYFIYKKADDDKIKREREDFLKWKQEKK